MEKRKKSHQKPAAAASFKRKRNSESSFYTLQLQQADANTIFALLIAALSNLHKPKSLFLVRKSLNKIRCSLYSETSFTPILALFPTLLNSKCSGILCRSADIVGAASLASFEMNREIALDCETLECLVALLASSKRRVRLSACNAVLDLSTTALGQQQLLKFSALEKLMFVLLQIPKFSKSVFLFSEANRSVQCLKIRIKEDELAVAFLSATIILLNACNIEQLQNIPISLSEAFLTLLKELWAKVRDYITINGAVKSHEEGHFIKSNIGVSDLAECIFRLSINACQLTSALPFEVVKRSLFGMGECSFEDFISNHWEVSPFLLSRTLKNLEAEDLFHPFVQSLNWTGAAPSLLFSNLQGLISCFPIASEEQDILNFLDEVKGKLGCPIIYHQDIRVVKTERHSRKEMHFFQDFDPGCLKEPHYFTIDDVFKCVEAYEEGYTIALRGLEFRYQSIAAVADRLAFMFGQPSVGANLYLTPPNSQGLACHFDDHCVFVCQIFGSKQWRVFSHPGGLLPRLYDDLHGADIDGTTSGSREFLLREGDVLYIPRGFPHEAYTNSGGDDGVSGFSLHLTLSVEVEPPFEWGGVAHFALHCWSENQQGSCYDGSTPLSQNLNFVSVYLLHVAIRIISNHEPAFRKACLAAAVPLPPDVYNNQLVQSQRNIFCYIIDKINTESNFLEVISSTEVAIQKNEDLFQQFSWLWHLDINQKTSAGNDQNQPFKIEDLLSFYAQHKDKVEAAFQGLKFRFCREVSFEDVISNYRILLQKYRKTRKQYMNGMISLHDKL